MARTEGLDGALARLAREAADASPRPGPDIVARVLSDAALTALARDAAEWAPRPTAHLVTRVLADAAAAGATRPAAAARTATRPGRGGAFAGLADRLFGWRAGAVAALIVALAIGLGIGMEVKPGALPILDEPVAAAAPVSVASLDGDILGMSGL